jgi:predicted dithiol-disulfide oxidoreductase (DUF899 family)
MIDHPIVSHEKWLKARLDLLAAEKELTHRRDALTRRRMAMPWERVEKDYRFRGPDGELALADLFDGRSQLILHQFMFAPYQRGIDALNGAYQFLDLAPKGRDEDAFSFPMTWVRRHDRY